MARSSRRADWLPAAALAVGAFRHYGWPLVPPELSGWMAKALGAAAILCLLAWCYLLADRPRLLGAVFLWWAFEEAQVAMCSLLWMREPWPVAAGEAVCSARVGADIGVISVCIVAALATLVSLDSYHQHEDTRP